MIDRLELEELRQKLKLYLNLDEHDKIALRARIEVFLNHLSTIDSDRFALKWHDKIFPRLRYRYASWREHQRTMRFLCRETEIVQEIRKREKLYETTKSKS